MQANLVFWMIASGLAFGIAALVLAPLLSGSARGGRRSSYDLQVYRDQLRAIDADVARGVLSEDEAATVRTEVSRRLLATADAEAAEAEAVTAPARVSRPAAIAIGLALALGGIGFYAALGAPGRPDLPLSPRLAQLAAERADRPSQAEVEAIAASGRDVEPQAAAEASAEDLELIEHLRAVMAKRPDDPEGQRLLARSESALGNWAAARVAQERMVQLLGPRVGAQEITELAEYMILAANGYVSPEAESRLTQALAIQPDNPIARYYSGLSLLQGGRPDLTYRLWSRLLSEGPPDAPWIESISAQIDEVAMLAGQAAPEGPSRADVAAAQAMTDADRAAMISGMVEQLSERLAAEGGRPEDWAQLIRSLGVLGRTDEAEAIWREAHETFAADPDALGLLRETAREAGVAE